MKRLCLLIVFVFILTGCVLQDAEMNRVISLRDKLTEGNGCEFQAEITADYGDKIHTFSLKCVTDVLGDMRFEVLSPETISGITGIITEQDGKLTFDDQVLLFETIADDQLTPVSAPWMLIRTLRCGYIRSCGSDGDNLRIQIDDSYAQNNIQLEVWVDETLNPVRGEILWKGRRILSIDVTDFVIL